MESFQFIDKSIHARHFFQPWQNDVYKERPKAILIIFGHWDTPEPTVNIVDRIKSMALEEVITQSSPLVQILLYVNP